MFYLKCIPIILLIEGEAITETIAGILGSSSLLVQGTWFS